MKKLFVALTVLCLPFAANAGYVDYSYFSGTNGTNLSATADFNIGTGADAGKLQIILTNTGTDVLVPANVLTALFFDVNGVGSLTPISALLSPGSTVLFGSNGGGNVGGEWAYASGLSGAPRGATEGISSSGFGLFGSGNFLGPDLDPPDAVNGLNYGIVSLVDSSSTGNTAVTGGFPLIKNSVTFVLSYSGVISGIDHVSFQYGTTLSESNVPEASALMLFGSGLVGLVLYRRKKRLE